MLLFISKYKAFVYTMAALSTKPKDKLVFQILWSNK